MDLDEIKRGLRAEIKKRENECYATFQCNVRQMCKDVLAKLEEQESDIAEKDKEIAELEERIADGDKDFEFANNQNERLLKIVRHQKYKRCLDKAQYWIAVFYQSVDDKHRRSAKKHHYKWLELAEKFKEAK